MSKENEKDEEIKLPVCRLCGREENMALIESCGIFTKDYVGKKHFICEHCTEDLRIYFTAEDKPNAWSARDYEKYGGFYDSE